MYLHNTTVIQHQHVDALHLASLVVMDLISALPDNVTALSHTMIKVLVDPAMQEYADEED